MSVQFEELRGKIENKKAKICIIGLGQVGLPTALSFANSGFSVTGVDTDEELVNKVNNGIPPFEEENLQEILENSQKNKRFHATTKIEEAIQNSNVIIVCVATPITEDIRPDMTHLKIVCDSLASYNLNKKLILIESSLPPGTFEGLILPSIQKSDEICWSCYVPERLVPGRAFSEIKVAPRLIGELNTESGVLAKELYKTIVNAEIVLTTFRVAEISKLVENTYRDVNIALVNELAMIFNKLDIDTEAVIEAAATKWNFLPFRPGLVGGHCIGVDPYYLTYTYS